VQWTSGEQGPATLGDLLPTEMSADAHGAVRLDIFGMTGCEKGREAQQPGQNPCPMLAICVAANAGTEGID